jgi:hypothetical protein
MRKAKCRGFWRALSENAKRAIILAMPRHEEKHMGKQISKPSPGKKPRPKRKVVVYDGVRNVMAGYSQSEKEAIEAALKSAAAIRRLPVDLIVEAPDGPMYTARVTDNLRLIYQIHSDRIEVVLLLTAGAVAYLRGTTYPPTTNGTP